jgi:TonB family protein
MHKFILLIYSCLLVVAASAQSIERHYFLEDMQTLATEANYVLRGHRNYDKKGRGQTTYYRRDKSKYGKFYEKNGLKDGAGIFYHENGEIQREGEFKKNKPIGVHHYYDVTAVHIRSEIYNQGGKIIAEYYLNKSGKKVFTVCDRLSSFGKKRNQSKAFKAMGVFIDENLIRPEISKHMDEVTVTVAFLIAPDGGIEELEIVQSVHPELNSAVMAVMQKMPPWRPAKFKRKAVYSEFSITVNF